MYGSELFNYYFMWIGVQEIFRNDINCPGELISRLMINEIWKQYKRSTKDYATYVSDDSPWLHSCPHFPFYGHIGCINDMFVMDQS